MYLLREGIELIFRILYIAILLVIASILVFLGLFFLWNKKAKKIINGWLENLSWYIEDKLNGE